MSYSTVNKSVHVRRITDGSQIQKNRAQAEAALVNASARQKKLQLDAAAADDKHEMHEVKVAREKIKLQKEMKEYLGSLSDEEKEALAAEMVKEQKLSTKQKELKVEEDAISKRLELKRKNKKYQLESILDRPVVILKFIAITFVAFFAGMCLLLMINGFLMSIIN